MTCQVFTTPPFHFHSLVEVSSCYCQFKDHILILRRHPNKSHGNTWGVPAGKIEAGEDPITAMTREIFEEIGLIVPKEQLVFIRTLYARAPTIDFIYHMFYLNFREKPEIILGLDEHQEYQWLPLEEAFKMPLMPGEEETLKYYKEFKDKFSH